MSRDFSEGKLVVMIGDFVHEGIKAAIEGYDFQFSVRKIMHRTEISIRRAINTIKKASSNNRLAGVIVYLPTPVFLFLCDSCFSQIKYELIDLVRDTNGYVFLYKDNFMGDFNTTVLPDYISFLENSESYSARKASLLANISNYHEPFDHWMGQRYGEIPLESTVDGFYPEIIDFLNYIKTNISNIFSFSSRNEVTLQIIDALNKVSSGEFLKIFISNGKYQAEQVERLIKLLEKYLQSAEKVDFTVNTQHIETGTIIILNSISGAVNLDNLNAQLEKFQDFMNVCQNNPSEAESILIAHGFDRKNAIENRMFIPVNPQLVNHEKMIKSNSVT